MMEQLLSLLIIVSIFNCIIASDSAPFVAGGRDAKSAEFPYQISIQYSSNGKDYGHVGGGSILSASWVLTAAHCVGSTPGTRRIVAGDIKCYGGKDPGPGRQIRMLAKFIRHPEFPHKSKDTAINDIGLIQLDKPFEFNRFVKAIQLPEAGSVPKGLGVITGWGATKGPKTNILQALTVPIYNQTGCAKYFPKHVMQKEFCADELYKGACSGDSGGPLAQNGRVIGIVAAGYKCANGAPTLYTKVSSYIDFIKEHMR